MWSTIVLSGLALFASLSSWNLYTLSNRFMATASLYLEDSADQVLLPFQVSPHQRAVVVHHLQHSDELLKQDELLHWGRRTYQPNRVLCAVPTTWNHSSHKIKRLQETWGPYCDKLLFVVAQTDHVHPNQNVTVGEVLVVNMTMSSDPSQRNIWNKVHNMWTAIADRYIDEYEWFLKVDDDTYLFVDHLRGFTQYYNPNIPRYFGHTILYRWKKANIVFNSGSAYVLSKEALRRVAPKLRNMPVRKGGQPRDLCQDEGGSGDDTAIAVCLKDIGIMPDNTLDAQGRQRFFTFQLHHHYTQKRDDEESWFWKYKPQITGTQENCCVAQEEIIAAHQYKKEKDDEHFYKLHEKALASRNHTYSVPPKPSWFWYDEDKLDFKVDEWRNSLDPKTAGSKGFQGYTDLVD